MIPRMLMGVVVLTVPVAGLMAAFGGAISWPAWLWLLVACTAVGAWMSAHRMELTHGS